MNIFLNLKSILQGFTPFSYLPKKLIPNNFYHILFTLYLKQCTIQTTSVSIKTFSANTCYTKLEFDIIY